MNCDKVRIRQFEIVEIDRIIELENSVFAIDAFSKTTFVDYYRENPDLFLVCEINKEVVAYMITDSHSDLATIVSIAVAPNHRRKGIGKSLVCFALQSLKSFGIREVRLRVRATNKDAFLFWESLGFCQVKVIADFYLDGAQALQMNKKLVG